MIKRFKNNGDKSGQTLLEYSIILTALVSVTLAMSPLLRRSFQGFIKVTADQVGVQKNADQLFDKTGHLAESYTTSRTNLDKTRADRFGTVGYQYADSTTTLTNSIINLGFTEVRSY